MVWNQKLTTSKNWKIHKYVEIKQRATEQRRNQGPISKYNQIHSHLGLGLQMDFQFSSVHFSHSVVSSSLRPHEPQHARPSCPLSTPRVYPNSCPLSPRRHLTISSSVVSFSSCLQSFPAPGSFQMSQLFASGSQNMEYQVQHQSFQWISRTDLL